MREFPQRTLLARIIFVIVIVEDMIGSSANATVHSIEPDARSYHSRVLQQVLEIQMMLINCTTDAV
jgi:hypothetical protein